MFESISWSQYFIATLICTLAYYLFIWIIYFKAAMPSFRTTSTTGNFHQQGVDVTDEAVPITKQVMDELRPVFLNKENKTELILALQLHLKRYRSIDAPGFREMINAFVVSESLSICSIRLGEEDQRAVWL